MRTLWSALALATTPDAARDLVPIMPVVDVTDGSLLPDRTLLVVGDRITAEGDHRCRGRAETMRGL
jgi:hypothetical protein